jgi:hypothetical protein
LFAAILKFLLICFSKTKSASKKAAPKLRERLCLLALM